MAQATKEGPSDPASVCPPKNVGLRNTARCGPEPSGQELTGDADRFSAEFPQIFQQCPRV